MLDEDDKVTISDNQNNDTMVLDDTSRSSDANDQVNTFVLTTNPILV